MEVDSALLYAQVRPKRPHNSSYRKRTCKSLDNILENDSSSLLASDLDPSNCDKSAKEKLWGDSGALESPNPSVQFFSNNSEGTSFSKPWKSLADIQDVYVNSGKPFTADINCEIEDDYSHYSSPRPLFSTNNQSASGGDFLSREDSTCSGASDPDSIYTLMDVDPTSLLRSRQRSSANSLTPDRDLMPTFVDSFARDDNAIESHYQVPSSLFSSLDRRLLRRSRHNDLPDIPRKETALSRHSRVSDGGENVYMELGTQDFSSIKDENVDWARLQKFVPRSTTPSHDKCNNLNLSQDGDIKRIGVELQAKGLKQKLGKVLRSKSPQFARLKSFPKVEQASIRFSPLPPIPTTHGSVIEDPYSYISDKDVTTTTVVRENARSYPHRAFSDPNSTFGSMQSSFYSTPRASSFHRSANASSPSSGQFSSVDFSSRDSVVSSRVRPKTGNMQTPSYAIAGYALNEQVHRDVQSENYARNVVTVHSPEEFHTASIGPYRPKQITDSRSEEERLGELDLLLVSLQSVSDGVSSPSAGLYKRVATVQPTRNANLLNLSGGPFETHSPDSTSNTFKEPYQQKAKIINFNAASSSLIPSRSEVAAHISNSPENIRQSTSLDRKQVDVSLENRPTLQNGTIRSAGLRQHPIQNEADSRPKRDYSDQLALTLKSFDSSGDVSCKSHVMYATVNKGKKKQENLLKKTHSLDDLDSNSHYQAGAVSSVSQYSMTHDRASSEYSSIPVASVRSTPTSPTLPPRNFVVASSGGRSVASKLHPSNTSADHFRTPVSSRGQEEYHAATLSRYLPKPNLDMRPEEDRMVELDSLLRSFDTSSDDTTVTALYATVNKNRKAATDDLAPQRQKTEVAVSVAELPSPARTSASCTVKSSLSQQHFSEKQIVTSSINKSTSKTHSSNSFVSTGGYSPVAQSQSSRKTLRPKPKEEYQEAMLSRYLPKQKADLKTEKERLEELDALLNNFDTSLDSTISEPDRNKTETSLNVESNDDSIEPDLSSLVVSRYSASFVDPVHFYLSHNIPLIKDLSEDLDVPLYSAVCKSKSRDRDADSSNVQKSFAETDDYAEITEDDLYNMPKRKFLFYLYVIKYITISRRKA